MCSGLIKVHMIIRGFVLGSHHPLGTEHLNSLIVSVDGLPAVVYGSEGAVFKGQCYHRSVPIAHFLEYWIDQNVRVRPQLVATSIIPQLTGAVPIRIVMSFDLISYLLRHVGPHIS